MSDMTLDPRLHAVRADLADVALRNRAVAERYVDGTSVQLTRTAPLRARPADDARLMTEALGGELARVFEIGDGWAWVQLDRDRYVGYVPGDALTQSISFATHAVSAPVALVFSEANLKSPPMGRRFLGEEVTVEGAGDGAYLPLAGGGFVHRRALAPLGSYADDFVSVVERFIGVPYLWGGKTAAGLDCSGLVQVALHAAGRASPRDSDMQLVGLGASVDGGAESGALRRGDLVFWNGHVGVMGDGETLLHANAFHMEVAREPLRDALARFVADGSPVIDVRRL